MNEKIDLTKILKNCPKGWEFYSSIFGYVEFIEISSNMITFKLKFIESTYLKVFSNGKYTIIDEAECIVFPSKKQRDWSKFTAPWHKKERFDPKTLKAFDRVLARTDGGNAYCWFADFVSTPTIEKYDLLPCIMSNKDANMIIPYNEDTKHLVGTTNEAPEYYRYWED